MKQKEHRRQQIRDLLTARELLTVLTLLLSFAVTYSLWQASRRADARAVQEAFDFRVSEFSDHIRERLLVYEQVLRATVGLFNVAHTVSRTQFHTFTSSLRLAQNYPGIQGVGYAVAVPAARLRQHEAEIRAEGFPDYSVKPSDPRDFYTAIIYLEPFSGRNLLAFGYDMYSEPNRRAAMAHARDSGRIGVTAPVTLVQEGEHPQQTGFLMYLPVYRPGAPHEDLVQRRRNLVGWVYAPFRMNDFMRGLQGKRSQPLDVEIYDGRNPEPATLMYDDDASVAALDPHTEIRETREIPVGDRNWTLAFAGTAQYRAHMHSDRPQLILQGGISISLLLSLLVWIFLDDRARALQAADQAIQLALYDPLTGLPNRKLLEERTVQALASARRHRGHAAMLFLDLDKFKPVNDTYGHAYGDLLLKEVAHRLQGCMREADTAARLGGDEFVVLLAETDGPESVALVAQKVLDQLTRPYRVAGHTFEISASIGAALYPMHGTDPKSLLKSADMAMYAAKENGRANVRFAS